MVRRPLPAEFRSLPAKSSEYTENHSRREHSATMLMVHAWGGAANTRRAKIDCGRGWMG